MASAKINPYRAGVPYTKQNHSHGQRREFRIQNEAQKIKENDVNNFI